MDNEERVGIRRKRLPFTQIENAVLEDRTLGKEHLLVYWTLAYHADRDGESCWPSFATIAEESRCSRSKVIEVIADLVKAGYLLKEARHDKAGDRTSNAYVLLGKRAGTEGGSLRDGPPQSAPETTVVPTGDHGGPPGGPELYPSEPDTRKERERGPLPLPAAQAAGAEKTLADRLQDLSRSILGAETGYEAEAAEGLLLLGEAADQIHAAWEVMLRTKPAAAAFFYRGKHRDYFGTWKPKIKRVSTAEVPAPRPEEPLPPVVPMAEQAARGESAFAREVLRPRMPAAMAAAPA